MGRPAQEYFGPTVGSLKLIQPHRRSLVEMPSNVVSILAFDPGGTTGWSLLNMQRKPLDKEWFECDMKTILRHKISWFHGQVESRLGEEVHCHTLLKLIKSWPAAAIVVEDFILRANRQERTRDLLSPVRVTAVVQHGLWLSGRRMHLQQPSLAKTTVSDERLKFWGCYTSEGGMQHARDADRHVLTFMRRCMDGSGNAVAQDILRKTAWPHIYGDMALCSPVVDVVGK